MDNGQGLILEVFNQAGSLVAQGDIGKNTVNIKGLKAGQADPQIHRKRQGCRAQHPSGRHG